MRKYLYLLKTQLSLVATYRFDFWWRWLNNILQFGVYFALWSLTAINDPVALKRLFLYYALYFGIVNNLQRGQGAQKIADAVGSGNLNSMLLKPVYYPLVEIIGTGSRLLSLTILPVLLFVAGIVFFPSIFAPANVLHFVAFLVLAIMGFIVWNIMITIIGYTSFWVIEIRSFRVVIDLIFEFLKGGYVPAYMFPIALSTALKFTFIPYLVSFPISVYMGEVGTTEIVTGMLTITAWAIVLLFISVRLYRKGLKNYEAYGN